MPDPASDAAATPRPEPAPRVRAFGDREVSSAGDVADLLGVRMSAMVWTLYKAPASERYTHFEIPKRSGGMRLIASPRGLLRKMQATLAPMLAEAYDPHPAAHGFLKGRSVRSNAEAHAGQRLVLNVDLQDFFPTINFGRVRGLFMAAPFYCGPAAAAVLAQICTHRNGLPQGAPTSPVISNFIAHGLDRRLARLAKSNKLKYSRYADDLTFSTSLAAFPPAVAAFEDGIDGGPPSRRVRAGDALEREIANAGFKINNKKVRLQGRGVQQSVTGLVVNAKVNVERSRVRRIRAMLHAWEKFGLAAAAHEHFERYSPRRPKNPERAFRNALYGQLAYLKMIRGAEDPIFLKLCSRLTGLDPNPSKFIRQMVFGANDFDVFISHASEDKDLVARPIAEACARAGLKAFFDEAHILWGESFTKKINTALGAARTVLCVISPTSVTKEWPILEVNAALAMEVAGDKKVVALIVGKPDLTQLPLIRGKDWMEWKGDPDAVARRLVHVSQGGGSKGEARADARPAVPQSSGAAAWPFPTSVEKPKKTGFFGWLARLFRRR